MKLRKKNPPLSPLGENRKDQAMQNEDRGFHQIGSLTPPTESLQKGSGSVPTEPQKNSATTGTPSQGRVVSNSTGRPPGGTGAAARTEGPGDIHRRLRALAEQRRNGQPVKSDDAKRWLDPAPPRVIVEELTKLRMLTAARNPGEDLDLLVTAYAERMAEYPLDIIRDACREMADKSKFFPAWTELKELMDGWLTSRREIVQSLNTPIVPTPRGGDDSDRIDRSRKAWAYVDARMAANDHALLNKTIPLMCWREMREFLFRRACEDLRAGRQPHISHADVDGEIARQS